MTIYYKKIISITFLLMLAFKAFAPRNGSLVIIANSSVDPYKTLIHAIGKVETGHDTLAYNSLEKATGYFQIRPIRLKDYNIRTGSNYTMNDLYKYEISEKIFMYYALQIGPYDFQSIAMNWNGSGPGTITYWNRVKKCL